MMIRIREFLLDHFLGTKDGDVLNANDGKVPQEFNLPVEIGMVILELRKTSLITDTEVDYDQIQKSEVYRKLQTEIYPALRAFDPVNLISKKEKLAFWINLYNLLTIDAVITYSIKSSVTEGWLGVIRFFRRAGYQVGGQRYSLENIEHGMLRANRGVSFFPGKHFSINDPRKQHVLINLDPRVHFALNCASISCPPIAYYTADQIDAQLDMAVGNFVGNETQMDRSGVALRISHVFKWYQKDFGEKEGVLEFLVEYLPKGDIRRQLIENFGYKTMLIYSPYDWHLNVLS